LDELHYPIGIEVILRTREDHRREFVQTLESLREEAPQVYEVFEDTEQRNRFLWRTRCTNCEAARDWLVSDQYRTLAAATKVLGSLEGVWMVGPTEAAK
jgi:hypothetical protein